MSTKNKKTEGEDNVKREFSNKELTEGITFAKGKAGIVTSFDRKETPKDENAYVEAIELNLAKTDAVLEKIKNLPKVSKIAF